VILKISSHQRSLDGFASAEATFGRLGLGLSADGVQVGDVILTKVPTVPLSLRQDISQQVSCI